MKRKDILIWLIPIACYIVNIIIVAVHGSSIINNITAWVCCILLGVCMIVTIYSHENRVEFYKSILKQDLELLRSLLKSLEEKEEEIEKLKEVKGGN